MARRARRLNPEPLQALAEALEENAEAREQLDRAFDAVMPESALTEQRHFAAQHNAREDRKLAEDLRRAASSGQLLTAGFASGLSSIAEAAMEDHSTLSALLEAGYVPIQEGETRVGGEDLKLALERSVAAAYAIVENIARLLF